MNALSNCVKPMEKKSVGASVKGLNFVWRCQHCNGSGGVLSKILIWSQSLIEKPRSQSPLRDIFWRAVLQSCSAVLAF